MKKIASLICFILFVAGIFAEQTVYYVSPTGDNTLNTGLSAESPFLTIKRVFEVEVAPSTNADILINMAPGTYPTSDIIPTMGRPFKVTILGESATTTIVERSTSVPIVNSDFRFFNLQNVSAGFELIIENITMQNFGNRMDKNWAGGIVMMNGTANGMKATFNQCVFKNNVACRAAILQSSNVTYEVYFDGCYFENCKSFDYGGAATNQEAPIYVSAGKLSIKNCIFNNNSKNPLFGTTDRNLKKGSLITLNPVQAKVTSILVNNTFVGNKIGSGNELALSIQPVISIADMSVPKKGYGIDLTLLNNLFIENKRSGLLNDVDFYIDPVDVTLTAGTHNVLNKDTTTTGNDYFSRTENSISRNYTFTSAEIDLDMETGLPKLYLNDNGVNYVVARGDSVVAQGISNAINSEVPTIDITGAGRKSTPDIGATDIFVSGTSLNVQNLSGVKIYTNGKTLIASAETGFFIKVSDITGKTLFASNVSSSFARTFDYSGILLVTIESTQGMITRKVIL